MKKIIVLLLGGIGDSLLATPFLAGLRKHFPDAHITTLVVYQAVAEMLRRHTSVDEVLYFDFLGQGYLRSLRYVLGLRRRHYDLSFLAYPSNRLRPGLIHFLIGAKERYGHLYDIKHIRSLGFLHTRSLPICASRHTIDENLLLLSLLGIDASSLSRDLFFPLTTEEEAFADRFLREHHLGKGSFLLGMHPGSSELAGMIYKRWPKEKFAELADKIVREYGATILLFGGENERYLKREIASMMEVKPIFVDEMSFFETAALIKHCRAFVSNDTGLHHVASYFKIPSVVITGHINPHKTRPLHSSSKVISTPFDCQPYRVGEDLICLYAGTPQYCLNVIPVDRVYRALVDLLR